MENLPRIMPFQSEPFNGDNYIQKSFLQLKKDFAIETVIETGTALGSTTLFLAEHFKQVITIELSPEYFKIAQKRYSHYHNIRGIEGNSPVALLKLKLTGPILFYLDAHWYDYSPLAGELMAIAHLKKTNPLLVPVIAIHDCLVPDEPLLGYDCVNGLPISLDMIRSFLISIYGTEGFTIAYNNLTASAGAKRGIIYISPSGLSFT